MISIVMAAAPETFNFTSLLTGFGGLGLGTVLLTFVRPIFDKRFPSRSDDREDRKFIQDTLNSVVAVLQAEKQSDIERLREKQERIDKLEQDSTQDYDKIVDLRKEAVELRNRLAQKDRHIQALVYELTKFGVVVAGLDPDDLNTDLTFSTHPVSTHTGETPTVTQ